VAPPSPVVVNPRPAPPAIAIADVAQAKRQLKATGGRLQAEVNVPMTQKMNGVQQSVDSRFQLTCIAQGEQRDIEARIRIKVVNGTGVASEAVKQNWGSKIERDWKGFDLVDESGKKWALRVKMEWVDQNEHYTVTCNRGQSNHGLVDDDGTQHMYSWGEQDGAGGIEDISAISHEVGHMLGNCDEYGNVTDFTGRVGGNRNYGPAVTLHSKVKQWDHSRGQTVEVDARRAYGGVKGNGIMGNVAEPPKPRNWYLVARRFARLQHPTEPTFDVRKIKITSDSREVYAIEAG
jgi:hypothetical protein